MMKIVVNHNSEEEELVIMKKVANKESQSIQRVLTMEELFAAQEAVDAVHIDEELEKYIVQIIVATREPDKFGIDNIAENILFGASPRASIDLYKAAKAQAFLRGNSFVTPADIGFVVHAVLRHRIVLSYEAMAKNMTADRLISTIIETLPIP
jgi:MoxR-like ATPase